MSVASRTTIRAWVRAAERQPPEEQWALLCFIAGQSVDLDEHEHNAALRRAELLLAAGGDPRRPLELYGRAVSALAADLDGADIRAQLATGLDALEPAVEGLRGATEALRLLRRDPDLAMQCYAMGLLAEALADDE